MNIHQWAARWGIPPAAIAELMQIGQPQPGEIEDDASEARVSSEIRLEAGRCGLLLWRNNSGVAPAVGGGRPVRYGLANDSPRVNAVLKSSDLIGVGVGGRFLAIETKPRGWRWSGTDREIAQFNFIRAVQARGGAACFATSWGDVVNAINA